MIIGIDNGLDGGLVALSSVAGVAPIAMRTMPCKTPGTGREVDVTALCQWILALHWPKHEVPLFVVEECPDHAGNARALRSMAFTAGKIIGALEARFETSRVIRVESGNRIAGWQRGILGRVPKGKTKEYALAAARSLWPDETWLATPRCKVPHDGLVDAALIAKWGLWKFCPKGGRE